MKFLFSEKCLVKTGVVFMLFLLPVLFSCKTYRNHTASPEAPKKLSQEEQINLTALFIDGIREKSLEYDDKALGLFSQCLKRNPSYAPAMYEIALIYVKQRQFQEALKMATNALKIEPDNEWYQKLLADIYVNLRDYSSAIKILKSLKNKHPQDTELAYTLMDVYIMAGQYNEAIGILDEMERVYGIDEETSLQKERLYLSMGKINKAINELEKLVNAFPSETKYLGLLAELYVSTGNMLKALDVYYRILEINPNDPLVHLSLADYYRSQNNPEKSFEELKLAFQNPDLSIDKKIQILLQYFEMSQKIASAKTEAYELLEILVRVHPDEAKAWSIYGDYLNRDNRLNEAREAFRKVISLDSSKYVVWEQLLILESELNDYPAMKYESERALSLFPEHAELYLYNGFAKMKTGKTEEAVQTFKTGLNFAADPEMMIKFRTHLGEAYYKLKKYDEAFDSFERVLKLDNKNVYVLNNYSYYLALQNQNLDRAEELAKKLNELVKGNPSYEDTYAWVLFKKEKYPEARLWLEKALSHGGDSNAVILEHYGDVLYHLNEISQAIEYWEKARAAGGNTEILLKKINEKKWYE